jgi:hypothetical protein
MTNWQPIDTAPRDGREILLRSEHGVTYGGWVSDLNRNEDYLDYEGWWSVDCTEKPFTHWLPVPEFREVTP